MPVHYQQASTLLIRNMQPDQNLFHCVLSGHSVEIIDLFDHGTTCPSNWVVGLDDNLAT